MRSVCQGLALGALPEHLAGLLYATARAYQLCALGAPTHRGHSTDTEQSNVLGHPLHSAYVSALSYEVVALARSFDGWANEALSELVVNCGSPRATVDPLDNSRSL